MTRDEDVRSLGRLAGPATPMALRVAVTLGLPDRLRDGEAAAEREYAERMWTRHTGTLAAAIADEYGVDHDDLACLTLARFVLEIPAPARDRKDRRAAVDTVFEVLTHGRRPPVG